MANNRNEIIDSDTNSTKQTDCFIYCNIPNTTNEGASTSEKHKFFHKILSYLMCSTMRIIQSKKRKFNLRKRSVSTLCKSEEKLATCASLPSIVDNVIKSNAVAVAKIKQKMIDAITCPTRYGEVFNKVTQENLRGVVEHFVHGASYRYAEYTAKYVDNAAPERGCGPLCIGTGTQSDTVNGEFSLEISRDAFAKACEKRRHADFILEKIAKVSDALTEKRLVSAAAKEQTASILASVSVTSMRYEMEEETCECTKPLVSSIIHAKEKPTVVMAAPAAVTVMQPETKDTQVLCPSRHFALDSQEFSVCLDKSLDAPDIQVIPSIEHPRETKHTRTVSKQYPERDDLRDTAITAVATNNGKRKKKEEEKESPRKISLRILDKDIFPVDKTSDAAVHSAIISCMKLKVKKKTKLKSLDLYQPSDICTSRRKVTIVTNDIADSFIETSQVEKEPTQVAKDILQESVPFGYKKPKYRAKYRDNTLHMTCDILKTYDKRNNLVMKEGKMPQLKEIRAPKDSNKILKCLSFPSSEAIKFFNYKRPATGIYQDCRSKSSRCLQPIRYCEDLISNNIYLGRPTYCDTPCLSSQNEAIQNATLSLAHCCLLQDSCATEYRANCHSLLDSHVSSRYCNINADCTKRETTFENSLYTNTYCKSGAKYCYPYLNSIDNARMGYYHCNDSCPIWNNNQHCERDRSYYWTKRNLYFTHP